MPSATDKFRDPADPAWESRVNELEEAKGVGAITQEKTPTEFFPSRLVAEQGVVIKEATAESVTQPYLLNGVGTTGVLASGGVAKFGEVLPFFVNINQPGRAVTGRTSKYTLYTQVWTGIAPGTLKLIFGLYEVESFAETEKQIEPKVSTTAKSTCEFENPAAKSALTKTGAAVGLTATGNYMFGFVVSGAATAAKSMVVARAQLFQSNV